MNPNQPDMEPIVQRQVSWSPPEGEVDLLDLWRVLVRQKVVIFLVILLSVAMAVFIAYYMQPVYRATVVVEPNWSEGKSGAQKLLSQYGSLTSMMNIDLGSEGNIKGTAIAMLKSRRFISDFINKNNITTKMYGKVWDTDTKTWKERRSEEMPTLWQMVNEFLDMISITENKNDNMVVLSVEWHDRKDVTFWANDLIEQLNHYMKQSAIDDSRKGIEYLRNELANTEISELRQVIINMIETQIKQVMLASIRSDFAFKVIDPAVVPPEGAYVKPKRLLIIVTGMAIGLFVGIFTAFLRTRLDSNFH